ncbi:MAG TPA: hypothetical protein VFO70_07890, partial [Chitinophagaceae bacterium]|nr:hypothetical protein [Chitinophagaceae bacterium]
MKNYLKLSAFVLWAVFIGNVASAQSVAINNDGSTPDASSILDIKSTTKGLLIPRMSKTERMAITTPATGLIVYQNGPDSTGIYFYNGASWKLVFSYFDAAGGDLTGSYP